MRTWQLLKQQEMDERIAAERIRNERTRVPRHGLSFTDFRSGICGS